MNHIIAVVGLGYVGLPLLVEFTKHYSTVGLDIDKKKIQYLRDGFDYTSDLSNEEIKSLSKINLTTDFKDIAECNTYVVTVPTPVNNDKTPDLSYLKDVTKSLSFIMKKNDLIIYESTVFPGCTEEICVPILEKNSRLKLNKDFFIGYSPERINPGDKINKLTNIKKITSGSNDFAGQIVDELYKKIISAGTYLASNIKVAEAAKVVENCQRDLNISFVNELAIIFDKLNLDTNAVLDAAASKWNFIKMKPGLVGGHCISVDPYYLTYKSELLGYRPEVILSGRKVNESIPKLIFDKILRLVVKRKLSLEECNVLILGITFKENCPDTRNSKTFDLIDQFLQLNIAVDIYDPHVIKIDSNLKFSKVEKLIKKYDIIIHATAHDEFQSLDIISLKKNDNSIIFDVKSKFPNHIVDLRL